MKAQDRQQVVDSYLGRAALTRAELQPVPPVLMAQALNGAEHVAELPCGPGHFLAVYAQTGARVTLIDASMPMLTVAARHARDTGVEELAMGCYFLDELPYLCGADLAVIPNGALNQLAAQSALGDVLGHLRRAVAPGTRLFLQALTPGDRCAFYTPGLREEQWVIDRRFPGPDGETVRRRRQYYPHGDGRVRVEVEYASSGRHVHTAQVDLFLPTRTILKETLSDTGWSPTTAASNGFFEILATATGSRR